MVIKSSRSFLLVGLLVVGVLFSLNFVVADYASCAEYTNTTEATCTVTGGAGCQWKTSAEDEWCPFNETGCCMDKGCWSYMENQTSCEANDGTMNCTWDAYMPNWYPNGTESDPGKCMQDWNSEEWGGMSDGAWQYSGDKAACGLNNYMWKPNGANENTGCNIKSLTDAQNENPSATAEDIGCCEQAGCWSYNGNESTCAAVFDNVCYYENSSYGSGWCMTEACSFADGNQTQCNTFRNDLYMPCNWINDSGQEECDDAYGDGGFGAYNDTDSCYNIGGWYNSTGDCVTPTYDGAEATGGGGFLFGGLVSCWFANNQPNVCGNLTGCAYCVAGGGDLGVDNNSADNICSTKQIGLCEGHDVNDVNTYANANNSASLYCADINTKFACKYGPLPSCKWSNSSTNTGAYCVVGPPTDEAEPPVPFCEHPDSKNNYTMCSQLIEEFMMPCTWDNDSAVVKNCTLNGNAVFGTGEQDFGVISSETSCTAAGGSWNSEYYVDGGILKQDSWCSMTGFFDVDSGSGEGNKGNCDTSCWSCEFQNNGTAWADVAVAEAACEGSVAVGGQAGGCVWTNDSSNYSFNNLGWCDYPKEMENGGAKDCNIECEGCNFMGDPVSACEGSVANAGVGCKWVNDTNNVAKGGYCVDKGKKTCDSDCFSCYDATSCSDNTTALDCNWDPTFNLCSPNGFSGEVCFNGVDDDSDSLVDCMDPDCGFDNFCGGSSVGGDCFAQIVEGTCNQTVAFGSLNCTWINATWNPAGWCDMPGANCNNFNDDLATCGTTAGCTNDSSTLGGGAWCEMNMTKMDVASCWNASIEASCTGNCAWKNNTWSGAESGSGWCEYAPTSVCMDLNSSGDCGANANCGWREDNYSMTGGWCNVACMDPDFDQSSCEGVAGGLCEWRNMSSTCQPETFMMMGASGGAGGKSGCSQHDGNETGCTVNNVTCTYKNDSYANNNLSVSESSGWCMNKAEFEHFGDMEGDVIDLAFDVDNDMGAAEAGVDKEVDIMGLGMRVTDAGFDLGAGILNVSETILCNGFMVGSKDDFQAAKVQGDGNKTTKFYWYLDTDGNESSGCVAVPSSGANLMGYDFMVTYVARNTSSGIVETKQLMRCSGGTWNPTNALVTTSKMLSCGEIGGVMIAVAKQDLESFSEYNKTTNMKIFMTSANDSDTRTSPSDSIGPGYYTPGTIDFGFVDCSSPANAKDPKCKNFQKFGFNVFEECKNGVDDDENGLVDCDDPFCGFMPACNGGSGFNFSVDSNDKTAPSVMFSQVDRLYDAAFVKIDTNEPSNLSLKFYKNDSTCKSVNVTLNDSGLGYQANANFKPFHSMDLMEDNLGYPLTNGTAYYYKITVCDPSANCAVSACSNFTTKAVASDKSFIFKMELPDGYTVDVPALNKTDYNFTETFNIGGVPTEFDVGVKTNTSVTKDMNMTIHCGDMSIGFYGMNVLSPTKIDLSNAFVCNESANLMGMNSSLKKWNTLIDDLHLGGATDYIEMTIPVAYNADNIINWTNDEGVNSSDVSDYVECSDGGASNTACKVPVSMGFSAYTVTPAAAAAAAADTPAAGGGGGADTVTNNTVADNVTDTNDTTDSDDENSDGDDGAVATGAQEVADFVKKIGWKSILLTLISLAVISGAVWYFLRDRRKGFLEIKTKEE